MGIGVQSIADLSNEVIREFGKHYFKGYEADMEAIMIGATVIRAHSCSAGYIKENQLQQALGLSRGGFFTKIHALVDALRNPLKFIL